MATSSRKLISEILAGDKMKRRSIGLVVALITFSAGSFAAAQGGRGGASVTADEQKQAQAIEAAPDATAKVKAGVDFVKKYPKSALRSKVAAGLADEISRVTDATQKIDLSHSYQAAFQQSSEQEMILPVLIEALAQAKRTDEAFTAGAEFLSKNPDSISVLVRLLSTGTDEAKARNGKYVAQSLKYGAHAIELIEANKQPADMDALAWIRYRASLLPSLYQSMGVLSFVSGDRAEAKARLTKAAELNLSDPFNYLLLASIVDQEYQEAAKNYQSLPNGAAREEALQKALTSLDGVIEAYARFIASAEGNARFADSRQESMQTLEAYYKYRHKNSTEGMQQMIDKYKSPSKP